MALAMASGPGYTSMTVDPEAAAGPARAIPDSAKATAAPPAMETIQRVRMRIGSPFRPLGWPAGSPAQAILFQGVAKRPGKRPRRSERWRPSGSDVEVQVELPRLRAEPDLIQLPRALVLEPGVDHVLREHPALQHELVVGLEGVQHLLQRSGHLLHLRGLRRGQVVEVLVDRVRRLDLFLHPVEARQEHRAERQVRVAGGVGRPDLDTLGRWRLVVDRDPRARAPVPLAVHEIDG